ncbi:MAG TPA: alpha/beta fold hydrolase [Azospirillaceae bacterium]|nr:alpha/beta fold hydrolase [Azospirillaceae bacterium]
MPSGGRRLARRRLDGLARPPGAYLQLGPETGPPIVLLHGFTGDLLTWQFSLIPLAAHHKVVALDLPGHGHSTLDVADGRLDAMVAWVWEALDAIGVDCAHMVGHSMGGKIAMGLALAAPERVLSLSLVAPAGLGTFYDKPFLADLISVRNLDQAQALVPRLAVRADLYGDTLARALLLAVEPADRRRALERLLTAVVTDRIQEAEDPVPWARLPRPIQFIWGAADTVIPPPDAKWRPADAPFHLLPGVGHLPQLEASAEVNRLVLALAGSVSKEKAA